MLDRLAQPDMMQRAKGRAEVAFGAHGLTHLYQSGCAKVLLPRGAGATPEAVLINTSGGITGGDVLKFSAKVEGGAALTVTTQAAERIYRASRGEGRVTNALTLAGKSRLEWLPQETIMFDGAALTRQLEVEMDESAALLALETVVLGRAAMGETVRQAALADSWRIRRGGRLAYADTLRFSQPAVAAGSAALFGGARALATLLYVAPDAESRVAQARGLLGFEGVEAAASAWNGMLAVRFVAADNYPLRKALIAFLTEFRGGNLPRVWHM